MNDDKLSKCNNSNAYNIIINVSSNLAFKLFCIFKVGCELSLVYIPVLFWVTFFPVLFWMTFVIWCTYLCYSGSYHYLYYHICITYFFLAQERQFYSLEYNFWCCFYADRSYWKNFIWNNARTMRDINYNSNRKDFYIL